MTLYPYGGRWRVASAKLPAADGHFHSPPAEMRGWTVAELFWDIFYRKGYRLPADARCCYMFEMTSPVNTVVVRHATSDLVCIGGRNLETLVEVEPADVARLCGWALPRALPAATLEEVQRAACELNPVAHEGFVVRDGRFRRVKVKSPAYVALHHLGGNADRTSGQAADRDPVLRRRRLLDIARCNEGDEFLAYYPQWTAEYRGLVAGLAALEAHLAQCSGDGSSVCTALCHKARSAGSARTTVRGAKVRLLDEAVALFPEACAAGVDAPSWPRRPTRSPEPDALAAAGGGADAAAAAAQISTPRGPNRRGSAMGASGTEKTPPIRAGRGNPFAALMADSSSDDDDDDN